MTGLTSLTMEVERSIEDAQVVGFDSFLSTQGTATVTHEFLRNVLLEGDVGYTENTYHGFSDRTDHVLEAGAGVRYLINRNLYSDLTYGWSHRMSNLAGQDYVEHTAMAKVGARF